MFICPTCQTSQPEGTAVCPVDGTRLEPDQIIGTVLGERYRILAQLGAGGMGTVYLCEHVVLGKKMAVKVLRPEYSNDEELVQRFQQEAVAASQIGHENIVDVTDFGRTPEGSLYFVMEALDGESLGAIMRRDGPMLLGKALPILSQVCRALGAAHARGIVHRDLKPDNVLVVRREDGSDLVKVLDFGISKMGKVRKNGRITRAGMIIGTPEYMAPEQAAAADVDHRADIYAFGVVAYEMVTGVIPFRGPTPLSTLMMHKMDRPISPTQRRPGLPREVESFVMHALEKKPEARQQDMGQVGEELSVALTRIGLAPVYTPTRPAAAAPSVLTGSNPHLLESSARLRGGTLQLSPAEVDAALREEAKADRPRRRWRWVALGALAVCGAALAVAWQLHRRAVVRRAAEAELATIVVPAPAPAPILAEAPPLPTPPHPVEEGPPGPTVAGEPKAANADASPAEHAVLVHSAPEGAEVFRGRDRLGVTPLRVTVSHGQRIELRFRRVGYEPTIREVTAEDGTVHVRLVKLHRDGAEGSAAPSVPLGSRGKTEENPAAKSDATLKPDPF